MRNSFCFVRTEIKANLSKDSFDYFAGGLITFYREASTFKLRYASFTLFSISVRSAT